MEDAWHAKCSSAWPPPPPASTSIPSLPPLPLAPSRSPGPASQTGTSSGQFFHPFAQGTSAGNNTVLQEPMVFNTLNLDSYNPGKAELSSSFLALLSGRPNHTSSEFCRLPYSGSRLANLQVRGGGIVNGVSCGVSIKSTPPLSENHGNDANGNGELSTNFPIFHNNFQAGATNFHTPCKPISYQACQGHSAGVGISSRTSRWPSVSSPSNAKQLNMLIQTTQKMPSEARASTSIHSSSTFRGRPRVFCMNKVGELFVSDIGLLGVLCFCHQLPMSVAKFCEHSGSPSANPGDAVHLENGMTVAQWRKLFFGVMTSDHGNRWDWSDASSSEGGSGGFPTSTKNSSLMSSFEASGGLGNQKSGLHGHNFFTKTSVSAQSTMPAFTKNNKVQVSKESPIFMGFEGSHLNLNQGKKNVESQLVANSVNYMGENGKLPISFSSQNHISRTYFPSERFVVDRDNISSNIELRLGHPSQKNNTTISCFPEAMNPIHLGSQNLQQHRRELGSNVHKDSESEDLMDDATKSSLISFLSHLNTEGNYPSNSTDIEVLDSDSHYSKYNLSDSTWELTDGIERKSGIGNIDRGKGLRIAGTGSCATFKSNYSVHNKTKTDVRVISSATGGHCIHTNSANDRQSTVYLNQYNHAIHKPPSPFNSFLNSETSVTLSSKNSINADILQNTRDGSLESISLRHLERSPSSLGTTPLHRRPCCLPLATEEPKDGPYCIVQKDASKINITLAHSFSNCYSGGDAQTSALKPDASSPFRCCDCSASTQRHTLCSKEHGIHFSSCHVCHVDEQPCLRLKEESSSFSGKCYCIAPQFLPGCTLNEHGCGKAKRMHRSPDYDRVQYGGRVRLGQCQCLRKNKSMKNDCHIALWRDVPNKAIGHSDATPNGKPVQVLQATHIAGDQLIGTAIKEPQQESESIREQQISNVSSGSSAPVVTEANNSKIMHDLVIDEGSGIEKCGSSDEAHDNRDHEDQLSGVCRGQANINHIQESESVNKAGKIKGPSKWSSFDASVPVLDFSSNYCESPDQAEEFDHPCEPDNAMQETGIYNGKSSVKRKRSALSSTKSSGKKAKQDLTRDGKKQQGKEKEDHMDAGKPPKFISLSCIGNTSDHGMVFSCQKARPVVCGNSGIISCGLSGRQKPAKLVSLSLILKKSSRCPNTLSSRKLQSDNEDSWGASRNGVGPSNIIPENEYHTPKLFSEKVLKCTSSADADDFSEVNTRRASKGWKRWSFLSDSDVFCCVCGSSIKDDVNQLLECNHCLIRVHQACYGVAKVPKGPWCCRPCKTNSFNTVCVLCGYGGGAMTRALNSQILVKSLLNVWKVGAGSNLLKSLPSSEGTDNEFSKPGSECVPSDHAYKSIIAGIFDTSITQWVHMVCGLWTPGTRCPNVDTMSTFDVSGASPAQESNVCSICNRSGGSCIVCRVPNCSVQFHPWCAHQKGLLQSEIEGDNNEKVGFYGRCMFHATHGNSLIQNDPVDAGVGSPKDEDWTCARMEGFKGRKRDEGFNPYHKKAYNDGGGCVVSQEQINAWLHINAQKPYTRGVVKAPCSDMEHDVRKEYMRYKQAKGWKSLVVYKSGIHALGLYTSQFIARGAMVVEYVGEIVGLRVADKREIEYQSGRRLQYKSACYFFRIDKEHIIDATRKGGIARFVNHSCLPNCVAKVISVRNEKKVVFFAERDIYPGEEITYDYHFNHEDEGEKIPCFCNSKNCRRSLN